MLWITQKATADHARRKENFKLVDFGRCNSSHSSKFHSSNSNLKSFHEFPLEFQFLKRKERELEHEMERLAKEKIASQNKMLCLKREFTQWDIDFTKLLPDPTEMTAVKSERIGES